MRIHHAAVLLVIVAPGCSRSGNNTPADTGATQGSAGEVTDSIVPGGPNGAVTSTSSTPTTAVTARKRNPAPSTGVSKAPAAGGEKDSTTQPRYTIDEKGNIKPIKK